MGSFLSSVSTAIAAVLLGVSALAGIASAQVASVRGVVTDAETRRPLQGAAIVLRQDGVIRLGAASDGDGYFILLRPAAGAYELSVSFVGYTAHAERVMLSPGDALNLKIQLSPSQKALDEVVIEDQADVGVATVAAGLQTITPSDVERVPVPGAGADLAGYLQTLPGIVSQGDRGGQIFIRGGSSDQNLAMLDGVPVYQPFHIVSSFSSFPEEIIDHADVYTGGFGARYASRASSVIDVSARNGNKQRFGGSAAVAPFLSGARIEGPLLPDKVSIVLSARQSLVEEVTPSFFGQKLPYRFGDRFGKLHAFLGSGQSVSLTALDTDDRGDIAGTLKSFDGEFVPDTGKAGREVSWSNTVLAAKYQYLSRELPILLQVGSGSSRADNKIGPSSNPDRRSSIESREVYLDLDVFTRFGEIGIGGRWRTTDLSFELGGQFQDLSSGSENVDEIQLYAESFHEMVAAGVSINPGLALYHVGSRGAVRVEPRLRVTVARRIGRVSNEFNFGAGLYHQGIVGLNDERDVGNIFTVWVPSADTLSLPSAAHLVAGWSGRFDNGLQAAVEGFVKEFRALSVPEFSAFPSFTTSLQPADGTALGFDARIDIHDRAFVAGSTFDGYLSYTFTDVEYRTATFSYHPAHHRKHQLNLVAHTEKNGVGITIQWQYGTGFPFTESNGFDEFHLLTPTTDVSTQPGTTRVLYDRPFAARQPAYERVDVWLDKKVDLERVRITVRAGIINLFNRDNLFYYDLFTLHRVDQMPLIPSVGLSVELQ